MLYVMLYSVVCYIYWYMLIRLDQNSIYLGIVLIQFDKVIGDMILRLGGKINQVKETFNPEGGAYGMGRTHGHKH